MYMGDERHLIAEVVPEKLRGRKVFLGVATLQLLLYPLDAQQK